MEFYFYRHTGFNHRTSGKANVKEYAHIWRTLDQCQLFLVTDGTLCIEQDGKRYTLRQGDYLLTERGKPYGGWDLSTAVFHWLHFDYPAGEAFFSQEPAAADFGLAACGHLERTDCLPVLNILIEQYAMFSEKKAVVDTLLSALLRDLCTLGAERAAPQCKDKRFQPIMDYFHHNPYYNEVKDVRSMAEFFGYSEKYLISLFKRNTGQSPLQYLTAKKMQRAEEMLADTDMTVKGVAASLHYDYYYFMRLFRKSTGMSPTQFRKTVIPDWSRYLPDDETDKE